jgi:Predicted inhibitor of MCP methylation, homolog of CheC
MFGLFFGKFLMDKKKISQEQFDEIMELQQKARVKLGFIAVSEKLLSVKQAEEINDIQRKMDRRFGDIAIEKGYLLEEEVTHLLNMQGNPYLQFIQVLTDKHILTVQDIEKYIEEFKKEYNLSSNDIDILKSGDIDRIIPVFVNTDIPLVNECFSLFIRNIIRFISSDIIISKLYTVHNYKFGSIAYQNIVGDHEFFVGLACENQELLSIAEPFAKEKFSGLDEDAFDSVCEFINCTNGLYASKLSMEDIHIDMTPPLFTTCKNLISRGDIYVVPVIINGLQSDLLITADNQVEMN